MDAYLIDYIRQRMTEHGHPNFHYEATTIGYDDAIEPSSDIYFNFTIHTPFSRPKQFNTNTFYIVAHNQYYFLVSKNMDPNLRILADNDFLMGVEATNYSQYNYYSIKEFTGQIFISSTTSGPISLEFIRCTPNQ